MSNDLKPSKQRASAVKKANVALGMIKRHILRQTLQKPCKSIVRILHTSMESVLIKDIELLEQAQNRTTNLIPEISQLSYSVIS